MTLKIWAGRKSRLKQSPWLRSKELDQKASNDAYMNLTEDCETLHKQLHGQIQHVKREGTKTADKLTKIGSNQFQGIVVNNHYRR